MRCLFITQEYAPYFADGGLGVTSGALPAALHEHHGVEHDVVLPFYPHLVARLGLRTEEVRRLPERSVAGVRSAATVHRLLEHRGPGAVLLIRADRWFDRGGIYCDDAYAPFTDEAQRAAYFGWCVADWVSGGAPAYDLVHGNDWQSGAALAHLAHHRPSLPRLLTIHNGGYRGEVPRGDVAAIGLPDPVVRQLRRAADGPPNLLLAALLSASAAVTCSPGYARELLTGSDGDPVVAAARRLGLTGITFGVDGRWWDPAAPGRASVPFDTETVEVGKRANKLALQKLFGLLQDEALPLVGVCSRLVPEKGTDLLLAGLAPLVRAGRLTLVLVGPATAAYRQTIAQLAFEAPGHLAYVARFDQDAAWLTYAGADLTVMPSRSEPGGLNQLIGYRYATLPVVSPVGGLFDTVADLRRQRHAGTGFHIAEHTAAAVRTAVLDALAWMAADPQRLTAVRRRVMVQDWSWARTAARYERIYARLVR